MTIEKIKSYFFKLLVYFKVGNAGQAEKMQIIIITIKKPCPQTEGKQILSAKILSIKRIKN
jgi:hypothetical protein